MPDVRLRAIGRRIAKAAIKQDIDGILEGIRAALVIRDEHWTHAVIGEGHPVMEPEEAAKWLEADRRKQVNEVIAARPRRGPQHY